MSDTSINLNERAGILTLRGRLTDDTALEFREKLDLLVRYYQHQRVTLQIHSEGGQALGLHHMLEDIESHRARAVSIVTEAPLMAGSAAAVLLTLGELGSRRVSRQTSLLFHHSRQQLEANRVITADTALQLARMLCRFDTKLAQTIVAHLTSSCGDVAGLVAEGLARCKLVQAQTTLLRDQLGIAEGYRFDAGIETVHDMWRTCGNRHSSEPYLDYLHVHFGRDDWMELIDAYALVLIDTIDRVPALLPLAAQKVRTSQKSKLAA